MARVGALSECPFQGDDSIHNAVTSALQSILGEQTKALVTQLTLFNQILVELRDDIRDQVKEMSLIRNTIMECQVSTSSVHTAAPAPASEAWTVWKCMSTRAIAVGPAHLACRAMAPTVMTSTSVLTLTPVSRGPAASTPCLASTARPVLQGTRAPECLVWASTMLEPANRSAMTLMNVMMVTTEAVTQIPSAPTRWGLSNVVPAAWVSWGTRARAAFQQGPATALPTAPATSTPTVSLNAMALCHASVTWAGQGMGTCVGLTQI